MTILKVYRRDSESSPLLHIHTPWAPSRTFVMIRKKTSLSIWGYSHIPGQWLGRRQTGQMDFLLHACSSQVLFALHNLNKGTKQLYQENPLLIFTSSLCIGKHYQHGIILHTDKYYTCLNASFSSFLFIILIL